MRISLIVCLLWSGLFAYGQVGLTLENSGYEINLPTSRNAPTIRQLMLEPLPQQTVARPIRAYCFKDLAFFCKVEVHLERQTHFPVRFRLGSTDYVDYLELKREDY